MHNATSPRPRQTYRAPAVALVVAALLVGLGAFARPAEAFTTSSGVRLNSVEARLVSRINAARVARGIPALRVAAGYSDVARRWALTQATQQRMYHNPNMVSQLQASGGSAWRSIGENVGYGYGADADGLFQAYWNSAPHRANILNASFRHIGIGWVERPDGSGYNTQNFVSSYSTTYGSTRVPAYGGRADTRVLSTYTSLGGFEAGSDQRFASYASSGMSASAYTDRPVAGVDNALRLSVKETVNGTGGNAGAKLRDAVDLRHVRRLTTKIRATSGSGRAVTVRLVARTTFGGTVTIGSVSVPSGTTRTVSFTVPSAARSWRNEIHVDVTRSALHSLSSAVSRRTASIAVYRLTASV
ncbi:MAG TPA: CAP domain-containing protein [Mycobacteriales bacterium]|nr:CAP domain-containing protein [Mycobacteriales bacterium]